MGIDVLLVIAGMIAAVAVSWGVTKATVSQLEKRMDSIEVAIKNCSDLAIKMQTEIDTLMTRQKEDRDHNEKQHEEFYKTRDNVTALATAMADIMRRLDNIENQNTQILDRLPERRGGK